MLEFFASAVSWPLALSFAAIWGAHLYQALVFYPAWASEPPKSLLEWLATPYAVRLVRFFRPLVSCLYTVATIAVILAVVTGLRRRLPLAVAGLCGLIHLAMVVLVFMPTNLKLGLDPGGPGASSLEPPMITRLLRRWGRWNMVRLGFETAGLIAALLALQAS